MYTRFPFCLSDIEFVGWVHYSLEITVYGFGLRDYKKTASVLFLP